VICHGRVDSRDAKGKSPLDMESIASRYRRRPSRLLSDAGDQRSPMVLCELVQKEIDERPRGRLGRPEIGDAVVFITSDKATFMIRKIVTIDDGLAAG
jgi:hypothetical protein